MGITDRSEDVQAAMPRSQILMAWGSEVTRVWSKPPLGLDAEDCVKGVQLAKDALDIVGVAGVDHIHVADRHLSSVQELGAATHQYEIDISIVQGPQVRTVCSV
jgi:hypothetical protein